MYNINYILLQPSGFEHETLLEIAKLVEYDKTITKNAQLHGNDYEYESYRKVRSQIQFNDGDYTTYKGDLNKKNQIIVYYTDAYYSTFLSIEHLNFLKEEYFKKYGPDADTFRLSLKESLDHYISYMLENKKGFSDTPEFKNYLNYIMEIAEKQEIQGYHLEYSTNVAFDYIPEEVLGDKATHVKEEREKTENYVNELMKELQEESIDDDILLYGDKIKFLARYFDSKRDLNDKNYEIFFKYIFNNLEKLEKIYTFKDPNNAMEEKTKNSPELISAILSYIPKIYGEGVENYSRSFLGKYNRNSSIYIADSIRGYTSFEFDKFCNQMKIYSFDSLQKSRTFETLDIMSLVLFQFHELSHQKQNILHFEGIELDGFASELSGIIRNRFSEDYNLNHDCYEIEIDADQKTWQKLFTFSYKYLEKYNDAGWISNQCLENQGAIIGRRSLSKKYDPDILENMVNSDVWLLIDLKKTEFGKLDLKKFCIEKDDLQQILNQILLDIDDNQTIENQIIEQITEITLDRMSDGFLEPKNSNEIKNQIRTLIEEQINMEEFRKQFANQLWEIEEKLYPEYKSKMLEETDVLEPYMERDLKTVQTLIYEEYNSASSSSSPSIFDGTNYLGMIFNEDGTIKLDVMYKCNIDTPLEVELASFIMNNIPMENIEEIISSGNLTKSELERFMHNFGTTIYGNTTKVGFLRRAQNETYDETYTNVDISSKREEIYDYYVNLANNQINKFNALKSYMREHAKYKILPKDEENKIIVSTNGKALEITELDLKKVYRPIFPSTIDDYTSNISIELKNETSTIDENQSENSDKDIE